MLGSTRTTESTMTSRTTKRRWTLLSDMQLGDMPTEIPQEQVAFDINDFAGGARGAIEAVLMVIDEPVTEISLASALELPVEDVLRHLHALAAEYDESNRGFAIRGIAGGWRVYSRSEYAPVVEKFLLDGAQAKLTQAALETLAVIAYRQPVSRSRVSSVRGVNVDGVVRTLLTRGLIEEMGEEGEFGATPVSYTHLRAHETVLDLVCRLLLE